MKKFILTVLVFVVFVIPIMAQVDHDYNPNDREPKPTILLTKDQVPTVVAKAMNTDFNLKNPETWTRFPYALKEYGWVYDSVGASNLTPDRYEVTFKTDDGHDMSAVYSSKGDLVATREVSENALLPAAVKKELDNSKYKDWTVIGNKEIIKYYHDKKSVEQHFRVTVAKDNIKRSISFNYQATDDMGQQISPRVK